LKAGCSFRAQGSNGLITRHAGVANTEDEERNMLKKQVTILFALALILLLASAVFAQNAADKQERVEGKIVRSDKDNSSLTVRAPDSNVERKVVYDSSTKWVSQYHGDKKINNIDPAEVKDADYVICKGTFDKSGALHATLISKRLSHSR
jgi:hypothetical protein